MRDFKLSYVDVTINYDNAVPALLDNIQKSKRKMR